MAAFLSAALAPAVSQTSALDDPPPSTSFLSSSAFPQLDDSTLQSVPQLGDSSLSSSPRIHPLELSRSILEEGDESESDSPNEPVTPVSGRQSQDFHVLQHDTADISSRPSSDPNATTFAPIQAAPISQKAQAPIILNTPATPSPRPVNGNLRAPTTPPPATPQAIGADSSSPPLTRRSTRGSTHSLGIVRTMSNLFRRSASQSDKAAFGLTSSGYVAKSDSNLNGNQNKPPSRSYTGQTSIATTQTNSPGSPGSPPLEMAGITKAQTVKATVPNHVDFFNNNAKKKNRASTGLSFHRAINLITSGNRTARSNGVEVEVRPARRRASSFDRAKQPQQSTASQQQPPTLALDAANPWGLAPDAGTGTKARRMSVSLPDDFTVDIGDLHKEYEYTHKMGRHRKHLGQGATSKVTLMFRKGCERNQKGEPTELVACKEFRSKSSSESQEEYDKKVKSEYSIAKSLVHPNIIETIRLCVDHGRWNHVMEYCSVGDLHSLVTKKYLNQPDREKDRFCLFKQLIQGLNYLHSHGIAHRDVKLENLLITSDSKLKITDFGVSEVFSGIHPGLREAGGQCGKEVNGDVRNCGIGICGSMPYISPEVLEKKATYDPRKLDVWGAAVVYIYLAFGGAIWNEARLGKGEIQYEKLVSAWDRWNARHEEGDEPTDTDYPKQVTLETFINPRVLRRLLLQMLNPDPAKRITMEQVASTRWIKNIECCQPDSYDDPKVVIDATKKSCARVNGGGNKIFCHNHLPLQTQHHGLPKMPGQVGY